MLHVRRVLVLLVVLCPSPVRAQIDPATAASAVRAVWGFATEMERDRETRRFRSQIQGRLDVIFNNIDLQFLNITNSEFARARAEFANYLENTRATDAANTLLAARMLSGRALEQYRGRGIDAAEAYQAAATLHVAILKERYRREPDKQAARRVMINEFTGPSGIEIHLRRLHEDLTQLAPRQANRVIGGVFQPDYGAQASTRLRALAAEVTRLKLQNVVNNPTTERNYTYITWVFSPRASEAIQQRGAAQVNYVGVPAEVAGEVGTNGVPARPEIVCFQDQFDVPHGVRQIQFNNCSTNYLFVLMWEGNTRRLMRIVNERADEAGRVIEFVQGDLN
ncbi:hypothetical protein V5E97_01235 [Singulisphaera sp. Ch08]|uniref:Uncharacterized protein n=1 Tax=Singulisphaera sp. Ch08 TaxID=3120278 RepID=A0AAU7CJ60_9BACT